MLPIADVPPSSRYLQIAARIAESRWHDECDSVRCWLKTKPPSISESTAKRMLETISAPLKSNENPLAMIHCYADVPAGTAYHVVFDPKHPDRNEPTYAEVVFGVAMGRYVDTTLSHGWHQSAVFRFSRGLPQLLNQLPVDTSTSERILGLCAQADFPEIKRSLENTA